MTRERKGGAGDDDGEIQVRDRWIGCSGGVWCVWGRRDMKVGLFKDEVGVSK